MAVELLEPVAVAVLSRYRDCDGMGVELRYEWDGDLRVSHAFTSWEALEIAATQTRAQAQPSAHHSFLSTLGRRQVVEERCEGQGG
jgi:hypothetical protein